MKITLETTSWAARYVDERSVTLEMPEGAVVADAIAASGIPADEAGIAVIDGKAAARGHRLADGDVVRVYPVIVGG